MKLAKQVVPVEFLENLPEGLKVINRKGQNYVIVEDLRCPSNHSLMSKTVKIHGEAAIHVKVEGGNTKGDMYLSPYWGMHSKLYDFMFEEKGNIAIKATCPVCDASLMAPNECCDKNCESKEQVEFLLPDNKNKITSCGTWNCPEHEMSVTNIPAEVAEQLKNINYLELNFDNESIGF